MNKKIFVGIFIAIVLLAAWASVEVAEVISAFMGRF